MHAVHIALQEGFTHDELIVRLDGAQIYHGDYLSTRSLTGITAAFDSSVAAGRHSIEINMPRRSAAQCVQSFNVKGETWLGISLRQNGQPDVRISSTPFGYL